MVLKLFPLSLLASFSLAAATPPLEKRDDNAGYNNPADHGGSMQAWFYSGSLINVSKSYPLNVIVSGLSTPSVLTNDGILDWMNSLGYSTSGYQLTHTPFGRFNGMRGNTGDGKGTIPPFGQFEIRPAPLDAYKGYVWQQRSTGAYFLAAYREILLDLPDPGRGDVVERATTGSTYFGGTTYNTTCEYVGGLYTYGPSALSDALCAVCTITATSSTS